MKPLREFTTGISPAPAILECQNIQQDPPENSQVCEKGILNWRRQEKTPASCEPRPQHGAEYGMALQFWPARMKELRRLILEEQQKARKKTVPCAFVTFRQGSQQEIHCA